MAGTIKEVYRDLLSSKDKEFANAKDDKKGTQTTRYIRIYGSQNDKEKKPTKVKAAFDGAISVGVDELTNTIIVSAQEEWMPSIANMILALDEKAKPNTTVHVHKVVGATVSAKSLQSALSKALGRPWPGGKPEQARDGSRDENRDDRERKERNGDEGPDRDD